MPYAHAHVLAHPSHKATYLDAQLTCPSTTGLRSSQGLSSKCFFSILPRPLSCRPPYKVLLLGTSTIGLMINDSTSCSFTVQDFIDNTSYDHLCSRLSHLINLAVVIY